jgi:hypothetical protein
MYCTPPDRPFLQAALRKAGMFRKKLEVEFVAAPAHGTSDRIVLIAGEARVCSPRPEDSSLTCHALLVMLFAGAWSGGLGLPVLQQTIESVTVAEVLVPSERGSGTVTFEGENRAPPGPGVFTVLYVTPADGVSSSTVKRVMAMCEPFAVTGPQAVPLKLPLAAHLPYKKRGAARAGVCGDSTESTSSIENVSIAPFSPLRSEVVTAVLTSADRSKLDELAWCRREAKPRTGATGHCVVCLAPGRDVVVRSIHFNPHRFFESL